MAAAAGVYGQWCVVSMLGLDGAWLGGSDGAAVVVLMATGMLWDCQYTSMMWYSRAAAVCIRLGFLLFV